MKVLVAYLSKTGNTKKVAEAIFGEIDGEKDIKPIQEVVTTEGYDAAFLGFPVMGEGPEKKTVEYLARHCTGGKKVALFITHASPEEAPELPAALGKFREAARGAEIIGMFDCQGQLAKPIKLMMSIMPNPKYRAWAKMDNSRGQPDADRLARARVFARGVMLKLASESVCSEEKIAAVKPA